MTIQIPEEDVNTVVDVLYAVWIRMGLNEPGKAELQHILQQLERAKDTAQ